MFPVHQVWPKPSCKAQWKGEEDEADRGRGGKTTSGNGQAWSLPSSRGQWRTGKNGGNCLWNDLWCPNNPRDYGIDDDDDDDASLTAKSSAFLVSAFLFHPAWFLQFSVTCHKKLMMHVSARLWVYPSIAFTVGWAFSMKCQVCVKMCFLLLTYLMW